VSSAAASARDPLLPQAPGGLGPGLALAVAAHAALVVALTQGVQWKREEPVVAVAELWASVPQVAPAPEPPPPAAAPAPQPAPPPPAAEPAPREAEIAIERENAREKARETAREEERERRRQAEREAEAERQKRQREETARREREQAAQRERAEREAKAEEERLAQQRDANLRRMLGQIEPGATSRGGSASTEAAPSANYTARLVATIRENVKMPGGLPPGNPMTEVEVRAAPGGSIISRQITKSSGVKAWDDAVLRAIDRTGRLPRDENGRVPSVLIIEFRPQS
jgi:colicin import membrane protein